MVPLCHTVVKYIPMNALGFSHVIWVYHHVEYRAKFLIFLYLHMLRNKLANSKCLGQHSVPIINVRNRANRLRNNTVWNKAGFYSTLSGTEKASIQHCLEQCWLRLNTVRNRAGFNSTLSGREQASIQHCPEESRLRFNTVWNKAGFYSTLSETEQASIQFRNRTDFDSHCTEQSILRFITDRNTADFD